MRCRHRRRVPHDLGVPLQRRRQGIHRLRRPQKRCTAKLGRGLCILASRPRDNHERHAVGTSCRRRTGTPWRHTGRLLPAARITLARASGDCTNVRVSRPSFASCRSRCTTIACDVKNSIDVIIELILARARSTWINICWRMSTCRRNSGANIT